MGPKRLEDDDHVSLPQSSRWHCQPSKVNLMVMSTFESQLDGNVKLLMQDRAESAAVGYWTPIGSVVVQGYVAQKKQSPTRTLQ